MAFAEDDAVVEFQKEKKELENDKSGAADEAHLAGWGSWVGEGVKQRKKKKRKKTNEKKAADSKPKKAVPQHVFVNGKMSESEKELKTSEVPYPFTSIAQYEASMALPLGREWNSGLATEDLLKPDITVAKGNYLKPLQYVAPEERKTKREKKALRSRPKNLGSVGRK
jgi:U3 small nucleolar RNA-associated protein 14